MSIPDLNNPEVSCCLPIGRGPIHFCLEEATEDSPILSNSLMLIELCQRDARCILWWRGNHWGILKREYGNKCGICGNIYEKSFSLSLGPHCGHNGAGKLATPVQDWAIRIGPLGHTFPHIPHIFNLDDSSAIALPFTGCSAHTIGTAPQVLDNWIGLVP